MSDYWEGNSDYAEDMYYKNKRRTKMAKTYTTLGAMKTKKEKDENGNPQYYIQLDKKLIGKLKLDGVPVTEFIQVERPTAKFDRMLKAGKIAEAEYDEKTGAFAKDGKLEFVKFDLQIVTEK